MLAGVAGAALVAVIAADSRNETVAAPVDGESRIGANTGNLNARWRGAQQMFANRQRYLDMARERGGSYRSAVYVRPDLGYLKAIPFKELISPGRDAGKTVFVPFSADMRCIPRSGCPPRTDAAWTNGPNDQCSNCASTVHPHGPSFLPGKDPNQLFWTRSHERAGINDQMAFGSWEAMRVYLSMWDRLPTTVQRLEKRFCCNRGEHIQFPESWQYHGKLPEAQGRSPPGRVVLHFCAREPEQAPHGEARSEPDATSFARRSPRRPSSAPGHPGGMTGGKRSRSVAAGAAGEDRGRGA